MNFIEKLAKASKNNNSLLCIGLDPDPEKMPDKVKVLDFNKAIIEATTDLVCAYKFNLAFYEVLGDDGYKILKNSVKHVPDNIPVIGDAKRSDIGNTARAYARSLFTNLNFDAVTVNPYLGFDSLEPFIQYHDRGIFILCRTSNAGAVDFQSVQCVVGGYKRPLFELVAQKVTQWNIYGNLGLVVGATYPKELKLIRQNHHDMLLLIPGIGAQGGELSLAIRYGVDSNGQKAIVNSSRQIIFASRGHDFAQASRKATNKLRNRINGFLPGH